MFRDWKSATETHAEALWFLMHRSFDPSLQAFAVTFFIDTSATDDQILDHAVLGGVLFNRAGFLGFDAKWREMLDRYGIKSPFHTHELCPTGLLSHIVGEQRVALLTEVAAIINEFKIHTLAVNISNRKHGSLLSEEYQRTMRVYPMAFIGAVSANHRVAQMVGYQERIAYVLDVGTKFVGQVMDAHKELVRSKAFQVGPLAVEDDEFVTALQASDVVAWLRRRIEAEEHIPKDFEPLLDVLLRNHVEVPITPETLTELNEKAQRYGIHNPWPPPDHTQ